MEVYPGTSAIDAHQFGMLWILSQQKKEIPRSAPRAYAGAVGVAGVMAAAQGTRRAVVLLLDPKRKDESGRQPAEVRDYLRSIGVPLYVWSHQGPSSAQRDAWGEIEDVSTPLHLLSAVKRLRQDLSEQSVVWLATDAWHALHATPNGKCKVQMLASQ